MKENSLSSHFDSALMNPNESEKRIMTILDSTARTSNSVYMKKESDKNKNGYKYFAMDKSKNVPQRAND